MRAAINGEGRRRRLMPGTPTITAFLLSVTSARENTYRPEGATALRFAVALFEHRL